MINLNYKNHNFIDIIFRHEAEMEEYIIENNFYLCLKCNNIFWYQDKDSLIYDVESDDSEYYIYLKNEKCFGGRSYELTCDEMIIKGIIE